MVTALPPLRARAPSAMQTPSFGMAAMSARLATRNARPFAQGSAPAMEHTTMWRRPVRPATATTFGRITARSMVTMISVPESVIWWASSRST